MGHSLVTFAFRMVIAGALGFVCLSAAVAQQGGGSQRGQHGPENWQRGPVYQRKAFDWMKGPDKKHGDFRHKDRPFFHRQIVPNVQSSWFTRPYPYHLDFYKMKYGGSYAPYFGNLYGPPQVVTAPPYYGPYYGGWGLGAGGWGEGGYNGVPVDNHSYSPGTVIEGPAQEVSPADPSAVEANGEGLPAPQ